mgnify:CR=1 FL=1
MSDDFIYSFLKKELQTKLINNLTDEYKNENIEGLDDFIINKVHEITNGDIDFNDIKPKKHINENKLKNPSEEEILTEKDQLKKKRKQLLRKYRKTKKSITFIQDDNPLNEGTIASKKYEKYKSSKNFNDMKEKLEGENVVFYEDTVSYTHLTLPTTPSV